MRTLLAATAAMLLWTAGAAGEGLVLPGGAGTQAVSVSAPPQPLAATAVAELKQAQAGQSFHVALDLNVGEGWAYYSPRPGEGASALPADVKVDAADLEVLGVLWPPHAPHTYTLGGEKFTSNAYDGRMTVYIALRAPAGAAPGARTITLSPRGQACGHDTCVRISGVSASVPVAVGAVSVPDDRWAAGPHYAAGLARAVPADKLAPAVQAAAGPAMSPAGGVEAAPSWNVAFWSGLGLALLAGLMLNIMPCVLPVIPLKVLGLVQQAGESRRRFVTLGLAFAAGIVLFFAGIAVVNAVLKLLFASTFRWGEHYQSPVFVIGMVVLLVAMALSMFGAFTVMAPAWLTRRFGGGHGHGHASAVGMGMFTAVLSTPCSFALLATALGWAQAQPLAVGSLAFVVIGIGMAAPYAVLTAFPGLLRHLPRPGRWMELFKQTVGFVMLLVAVWLARGLFTNGYPFWVMGWVIVVAACIWAWMKWVHPAAPLGRRLLVRGPLAVVVFAAGLWMLPPQGPQAVDFEPFDEARIVAMRQAGSPVLIDFTASWCVTCQYVGEKIYNDPAVAKELRRRGVVAMVGDVTREDVPADRFRRQLGEAIPVTVILPPGGGEPIMLRGVFSKDDLWRALDQAQPPRP